jgi:hypothetical protein
MRIIRVHPPSPNPEPDIPFTDDKGNHFVLADPSASYFVEGEAATGRYRFCADLDGAHCVFRYHSTTSMGETWEQIRATPALSRIARKVVRKAISPKN